MPHLLQNHSSFETLGSVDAALKAGLLGTGYTETSYYSVPNGFALVTRIERIERNGAPSASRWAIGPAKLVHFSLREYLRALFTANPGHYRVLVFIVTDAVVTESEQPPTSGQVQRWLRSGGKRLPEEIAAQPWTPRVTCTALIYEFVHEQEQAPKIQVPSELDGVTHLERARLWAALGPSDPEPERGHTR